MCIFLLQSSSSTMGHTPSHVSPAVMGYSVESLSPVPREQEMMPNKILRVIVDNMQYRVDLEAIHQVCTYTVRVHILYVCTYCMFVCNTCICLNKCSFICSVRGHWFIYIYFYVQYVLAPNDGLFIRTYVCMYVLTVCSACISIYADILQIWCN